MDIRCSVFCGASLDGFIAGPGGELEWLHRPEYSTPGPPGLSYASFISTVDTLVMGRHTFEKVLTFEEWPYELPVVVLSSTLREVPEHLREQVRVTSSSPGEVVRELAREGRQHLYVDGGITIQRFLQAGLIHEITVTWLPILLGAGIPLFGSLGVESPLRLLQVTSSENGMVQLRYRVEGAIPTPAVSDPGPPPAG